MPLRQCFEDDQGEEQLVVRVGRTSRWARSTAGWQDERAEGLFVITFSVGILCICVMDQQGAMGGTLPNTSMLLKGKAMSISVGGTFVTMSRATWRAGLNCADTLFERAVPNTAPANSNFADVKPANSGPSNCVPANYFATAALFASYARTHAASYSAYDDDWRARLSGAAGGIPPARH